MTHIMLKICVIIIVMIILLHSGIFYIEEKMKLNNYKHTHAKIIIGSDIFNFKVFTPFHISNADLMINYFHQNPEPPLERHPPPVEQLIFFSKLHLEQL